MLNPQPRGTFSGAPTIDKGRCLDFLEVGHRYRVTTAFTDFDREPHFVGETWTFLGHDFLPYEDGMSFFVATDDGHEWQMRLQWRPEAQGKVLSEIRHYIAPAE
jgi:hypothetical protein